MSSYTKLERLAQHDELMADLYALTKFLDENIDGPDAFYFERPKKGFIRPSLHIKFVDFANTARNDYWSEVQIAVMVQYFTEDILDANYVGSQITKLLSGDGVGLKDVILPRYDFDYTPPKKMPVSMLDLDGNPAYGEMGPRVDPSSISATTFQEDDGTWNVPVTFNMKSPRIPKRCFIPLKNISVITRIGSGVPLPAQIVEAGVSSTAFIETMVN